MVLSGLIRVLAVMLLAALLVPVIIFVWPREKEPQYHGKRLSKWLGVYRQGMIGYGKKTEIEDSITAVTHIGTNGIPLAISWLRAETPGWKRKLTAPVKVTGKSPPVKIYAYWATTRFLNKADIKAGLASDYFEIMGDEARSAVPEMVRWSKVSKSRVVSDRFLEALTKVGTNGLAALDSIINDPTADLEVRCDSAYYLGWSKTDGGFKTEIFLRLLKDEKTPIDLRYVAIVSLEGIGPEAKGAEVTLVRMLAQPDEGLREPIIKALKTIAPELLTNAVTGKRYF